MNLELKSGIFPVQYTDERLDVTSLIRKQAELICTLIDKSVSGEAVTVAYDDLSIIYMALLLYNVKHKSWSYENEYRYLVPANISDSKYAKVAPKAIYIGLNCDEIYKKSLSDITDYWDIPLYQMGMEECSEKYELVANLITE